LAFLARLDTDSRGQSTAEYALIIILVVAVAGLGISFVSGSGLIEKLFGSVIGKVIDAINPFS
jgi:hypothetical protein